MNKILPVALDLLSKGFSVIPVSVYWSTEAKAFKKSFPVEWLPYKDRQPTEAEIRSWWTEGREWGIAMVCGFNNIYVLDVDAKAGPQASALLEVMRKDWADRTLAVETANGGLHLWFEVPDMTFKNGRPFYVDNKAVGEIRGNGALAVIPPTEGYAFANDLDPMPLDLPTLDQYLYSKGAILSRKKQGVDNPNDIDLALHQGEGRNQMATEIAGWLREKGFSTRQIGAVLLSEGFNSGDHAVFADPITEEELERTVLKSAKNWEQGKFLAKPEPKDPIPNTHFEGTHPAPVNWIIDGIIPKDGTTVIAGKEGTYKTFTLLEMMYSRGEKFLDKFKTSAGKCLYIDGENGINRIHRRVHELGHGADKKLLFFTWHLPGKTLTEQLTAEIIEQCKELGCDTVIFDPYKQFMGGDEDKANDTANFYRYMTLMHDQGLTTIVIHHTRKVNSMFKDDDPTTDDLRGSSALAAHASAVLQYKKVNEGVRIYQTKMRDSEQLPTFLVKVEGGKKENGDNWIKMSYGGEQEDIFSKQEEAAQAILDMLGKYGAFRKDVMTHMRAIGCAQGTAEIALKGLVNERLIMQRKEQRQTYYYIPKDVQPTFLEEVTEVFPQGVEVSG